MLIWKQNRKIPKTYMWRSYFFCDCNRMDCNYFSTNADILQEFWLNTFKTARLHNGSESMFFIKEIWKALKIWIWRPLKFWSIIISSLYFTSKRGKNFRLQIKTSKNSRSHKFLWTSINSPNLQNFMPTTVCALKIDFYVTNQT